VLKYQVSVGVSLAQASSHEHVVPISDITFYSYTSTVFLQSLNDEE
jgi:hypothetical protein